jgi:ribonucleoside-triphosphate reductase (formate)
MSTRQEQDRLPHAESDLWVRQSDESVEPFDPRRITDALVRETGLASDAAEAIALEVREQIDRSGIQSLTAPLIRGLVDARLLELGLLREYRAHARLGVPAFDVDRIIQAYHDRGQAAGVLHGPEGSSLALAEAIKREYAILNVFSDAVASAHLTGDLHIENIGDVDRPTTMIGSVDFIKRHGVRLPGGFAGSRPARRADVLVLHLVTYTAALQGYFSEALAWDSVNYALAPLLVGLNQREIRQAAQGLLFELSAPSIARGGQPVRCDLHLDWEAPAYLRNLPAVGVGGEKSGVRYGAMNELARAFLTEFFTVYLEGDAQGLPFIGPRPVLHLGESFLADQRNRPFLDLVIRAATKRGGLPLVFDRSETGQQTEADAIASSFTDRYGVSRNKLERAPESWQWRASTFSSVAINLPRVGFQAGGDQTQVFELLSGLLELAAQASLEKRIFLEKLLARGESGALAMLAMRPDKEPFLPLNWTSHAICPVGLAELVHAVVGTSLDSTSDAQGEARRFAAAVVAHLDAEAARLSAKHKVRFTLAESHDWMARRRLARLDLQRFGAPLLRFARGEEDAAAAADHEADVYYTNGVKLPENCRVDDFERIRIEGELQAGAIRGATTDLWLGQDLPESDLVAMTIAHALRQTDASAITFSPEFTICLVCHTFTRGAHAACSNCGSNRVDGLAQAGSRHSRTSNWPRWMLTELERRRRSRTSHA